MARFLNAIVDVQSVVAIVLAAGLILGAFEKVYLDGDLQKNAAGRDTKAFAELTPSACEDALPGELKACGPHRFDFDSLALGSVSSP